MERDEMYLQNEEPGRPPQTLDEKRLQILFNEMAPQRSNSSCDKEALPEESHQHA